MMSRNTDFIPFARPSFSEKEGNALSAVLKSGWLTTGAVTAEFEKKTAEAAGTEFALAVNSATSGLHLSLETTETARGDFVITTPYTFTATAEIIRYTGAHPLFVDIEQEGYNISPTEIERVLETFSSSRNVRRITAVIPVHIGGMLCRRSEILGIAEKYKLAVIEDGAHLQPDPLIKDNSSILVYSFYATKCISTGEGGMIVTNNTEAAERMKTMRFHGIDREAWDRYRKKGTRSWEYDVKAPGYKYNLPDTASALGLVQLERAAEMLEKRKRIAAAYNEAFSDYEGLILPPSSKENSWHLYMLRINEKYLSVTRDQMMEKLSKLGIATSMHYKPLHLMSYYKNKYGLKPEDFPESLNKYKTSFSIPIYPDLTDNEISRIIHSIRKISDQYGRSG